MNNADPSLINEDLAPTPVEGRTWSVQHMASLWIGMVVCVPTYMLAGGLIELGMNAWQALFTITVGNAIVLVPMILNGHGGTKYGVPFPVLARASFGILGANIPALLRGVVACGWFGIQTWIGGSAIYQLINVASSDALVGDPLPFLGINAGEFGCFLLFWALQVWIIWKGIESIKIFETYAAPVLVAAGMLLLIWAYSAADGFGGVFAKESEFDSMGGFMKVFIPSLTAMVGFWATLSLNIPDFTRYAKSQRDQVMGQAIGLPLFMLLFSFIGVAVTAATPAIFGVEKPISDPVAMLGMMDSGASVVVALAILTIATLSTNIAANVVAPANALINLSPARVTFRVGALITAGIGVAIFPWKIMSSAGSYIFVWLGGYSTLLGPIAGILIADYFLYRKTRLNLEALYQRKGDYWYANGYNSTAIVALVVGILPCMPGFLVAAGALESTAGIFEEIFRYGWFFGFFVSGIVYLMGMRQSQLEPAGHA
ncbi:MAG: NCS1 family nucleobase:cation symporter-1 [Myxococcota bacterium]|nr:NCS1 family nucleobase:cation symporter-1 [Myxococcota bacterium]